MHSWLAEARSKRLTEKPLKIQHLIPAVFDNYMIILWPVGVIDDFPFCNVITQTASIEQLNRNIEIWSAFNILYVADETKYRPSSYKKLSDLFKLSYDRNIYKEIDWQQRGIMTLLGDTEKTLYGIIEALKDSDLLNLIVEGSGRWESLNSFRWSGPELAHQITTADYLQFMKDTFYDSDSYLFPHDKSWCLVSFEDLELSLLGVNQLHVRTIEDLNILDIFPVSPTEIF